MDTAYSLLIEKLSLQAGALKLPLNGSFELTSRCNFNCRMCYIHNADNDCSAAARELTTDQWLKLASDARDAGMLNLLLTGGEIFLRQDFETIYESVARMGFNITLYTNASLIDDKRARWLGKIPPTTMEITLYGASADTYDKVCGNAGAYEQVTKAIDLLLAEGINIELKTTVTRYNKNDYDKLAEFSYKRGIPLSIVNYLYPVRSTQTENACRLTPEDLLIYEANVFETNRRLAGIYSKGEISQQSFECADKLKKDLRNLPGDPLKAESAFGCNAGSSDFWITWDGRMTPCGAMEEPVAYPLECGFAEAWKTVSEGCQHIPVCKECRNCDLLEYCIICPAKLKCETGSYDHPAEYLCKLAKGSKERFFNGGLK